LKLENVYGGDGFVYLDTVDEVKLARSKTRVTIRKDIGVPITSEQEEKKTEKREIEVHTFKHDKKGNPLLRLGGSHGKLWGAIKEAGYMMYSTGEMPSKAEVNRIMQTVRITPEWVILNTDGTKMTREILAQVLNTFGNSQVQMYYDVIPNCKTEISLKYPDVFKDKIEKMLEYFQTMNCLNKRRASITILN
jgi:hypothetical protein